MLTDDNYKQFIDSHPIVLVHFYTEWCAKCKALTPKLQAVAFKAKEKGWPVAIAKVDAKAHEEASKDVYGYPELRVYGGPAASARTFGQKDEEYQGERDVDSIMAYLERLVAAHTLPSIESDGQLASLHSPRV